MPRVEQRVEVGRKRGDGETSWVCFGRIAHISGQPSAAGDDDTSGGFGHAELFAAPATTTVSPPSSVGWSHPSKVKEVRPASETLGYSTNEPTRDDCGPTANTSLWAPSVHPLIQFDEPNDHLSAGSGSVDLDGIADRVAGGIGVETMPDFGRCWYREGTEPNKKPYPNSHLHVITFLL